MPQDDRQSVRDARNAIRQAEQRSGVVGPNPWGTGEYLRSDEENRVARQVARVPVRDAEETARSNATRANRRYAGRK